MPLIDLAALSPGTFPTEVDDASEFEFTLQRFVERSE
jgi:hypothetical protein